MDNNKTYIEFFYFDKYKRKISQKVNRKDYNYYKILYLEKSLVDNIGDVWLTKDNLTTKLDYYND